MEEEIPTPAAIMEILSLESKSDISSSKNSTSNELKETSGQIFNVLKEFNCENLLKMQQNDPLLRMIMEKILKEGNDKYPRYRVINSGLLCRLKSKDIKNPTIRDFQICLNEETACNVLALTHAITHAGYHTTIKLFKRFYHAKNLGDMARSISIACKHCMNYRMRTNPILQGYINTSTKVLETLLMDHMTLKPCMHQNQVYRYILTIVDEASRYCFSVPVRTLRASEVCRALENLLSTLGGQVKKIITDNAADFVNDKVKQTASKYGVEMKTVLPYSSTSNGIVELMNRRTRHCLNTIGDMLNKNWYETLPLAKIALNSLPIGTLNGKNVVTPHDILFGKPPNIFTSLENAYRLEDTEDIEKRMERIRLEEFLEDQKKERMEEYEQRQRENGMDKYKEGALVLRQVMTKYNKEKPKYHPDVYIITNRKGLQLTLRNFTNQNDHRIIDCHIRQVKIHVPRDSKYFVHLDESIKRLLGYPTDNKHLEKIKDGLVKNHDFSKEKKRLLKIKVNEKTDKKSESEINDEEPLVDELPQIHSPWIH